MTDRPPTSAGPLAFAALRLALARNPVAWGGWAALFLLNVGLDIVARRAGVGVGGASLTPAFWTYTLIDAAASALVSGVALHALITGRAPARLGGGYFGFVGLMVLTELFWIGTLLVFAGQGVGGAPPAEPSPELLGRSLLFLVVAVLGVIVCIRLLLWPIGLLLGRPVKPSASWRLMRGMLGSYILATIVLSLPVMLIGMGLAAGSTAGGGANLVSTILVRVMDVVATAAITALSAVVWMRRAGDEARLASTFD